MLPSTVRFLRGLRTSAGFCVTSGIAEYAGFIRIQGEGSSMLFNIAAISRHQGKRALTLHELQMKQRDIADVTKQRTSAA